MYQARGLTELTAGSARLSFRDGDDWMPVVPDLLSFTGVVMGAETSGPWVTFIACKPADMPPAPTHAHASDTLRLCIRGEQRQGHKSYNPGEFRFQEGWVPYANEGYGPDGMWGIIMLADRRGNRVRFVDPELDASPSEMEFRVAQKERNRALGIEIDDQLSDDPTDTAGPSAIVTTIGPLSNAGKLDGSFADRTSWRAVGSATRVVAALMGEPLTGPVVVLAATDPGGVAAPKCRFGTELLRVVVSGSCTVGGNNYESGEALIQDAGAWCDEVVAGPDGLHELIVLSDRRYAVADLDAVDGPVSWPSALGDMVRGLTDEIASRPASKRGRTFPDNVIGKAARWSSYGYARAP